MKAEKSMFFLNSCRRNVLFVINSHTRNGLGVNAARAKDNAALRL